MGSVPLAEGAGHTARPLADRVTVWTLRAGAVALPLAMWPAGYDAFVLPKLAVLNLLVLALLGLRVAAWVGTGRLRGARTPLDLPLAAVVVSAAISTALAVNVNLALFGAYYRYEGLITIVSYTLLFRLSAQALDRDAAWSVARALLLGGYLASLLAIAQSLVGGAMVAGSAAETARTFGGVLRASSTFGNAAALSAFLAMLLPLAVHELLRARSGTERIIGANVAVVLGLALALTYSRAAWLGAALGVAVAAGPAIVRTRRTALLAAAAAAAVVGGLVALAAAHALPAWAAAVLSRVATLADPAEGSGASRLHIWHDTLALVAARPWVGWGPDTFGLVYQRFQTGDWTPGFLIDKAHSDVLQVAATQGLLGVAAYVGLLAAVVVAWWRGRARPGAAALIGAWLAYVLPLQVGFSWLPGAAPAWLLLAVAVVVWGRDAPGRPAEVAPARAPGVRRLALGTGAAAALTALLAASAALPLAADARFRAALLASARGDRAGALSAIEDARRLAPEQGVYAANAGDLLLDLGPDDRPGPAAEPAAARPAYLDALRLGDARPEVSARLDLTRGR
ncbi:MAG TPA: O-antigen ligase family protein [Candidatus Dormibacteraeota bacterium]